jgi:AcrR family transcriptional regulator
MEHRSRVISETLAKSPAFVDTVSPMSELRRKIAVAAQDLYLSEGLEGVSMRKVADRVGVSAPAIYRHFRNKQELLNEIVLEGLRILERYLEPALKADTPLDRLRRMTESYLDFALEQPKYFDFAFLIPNPDSSQLAEEVARPGYVTFRLAIEQISACMQQGVLAPDNPLETAITFWAEVHGLITLYRTGRFGQDAGAFRETYRRSVDRVLAGMKPVD